MIGIIGAMDIEVEGLKNMVQNKSTRLISGIEFISGTLEGKDVVIAKCGIGKVFAALCAQTMILEYNIDDLINTGVAGTLTTKLSVGDIAISTDVVQHDMDTSPIGDPVGLISGINVINFPADSYLVSLAEEIIGNENIKNVKGIIATGDSFIAKAEQKEKILSNFCAVACEMEGGAIGHVAYVNNVKFLVLRAISDSADGSAHMDYPTFLKMAAENSVKITQKLVARI